MMKEYIVSLRSHEELEEFYDDMETPGGSLYIPDRMVNVSLRRPISRNTHYLLTEDEVELLKNDPRVLDVILKEDFDSRLIEPEYTQTGRFDKDLFTTSNDKNWALLRCVEGQQRENWGDDSTNAQSDTIKLSSIGRNVDVVIMDGHINPNHPEYAVNPDGTGGSRVNQFNWYSLTNLVTGGSNSTYSYPTGVDLENDDDNHGAHVAGTACGNTQGWARGCTIYNISPYATNPNTIAASYVMDYVRVWHENKPINPETGRKNPTIVNMSFGSTNVVSRSSITSVNYRGSTYNSFTDSDLNSYGLVSYDLTNIRFPANQYTASTVDLEDMINAGIIVVGSAGNRSYKQTRLGDIDYNNTITYSGTTRSYHRGDWRYGSNIICVGAISALVNESKATFSHCGNRIDVFAPGVNIISSVHTNISSVDDPRNSSYKLAKYDGTSMASPQVTGVIACVLEQYPRMQQADVLDYLNQNSKREQMTTTSGGYTDNTDLQGAPNKFLFYKKERRDTGALQPRETHGVRPSSGQSYPRRSVLHYKK